MPTSAVIPVLGDRDVWTFSRTIADVDPAAWGGALVE
jgi:hypothetical protein